MIRIMVECSRKNCPSRVFLEYESKKKIRKRLMEWDWLVNEKKGLEYCCEHCCLVYDKDKKMSALRSVGK